MILYYPCLHYAMNCVCTVIRNVTVCFEQCMHGYRLLYHELQHRLSRMMNVYMVIKSKECYQEFVNQDIHPKHCLHCHVLLLNPCLLGAWLYHAVKVLRSREKKQIKHIHHILLIYLIYNGVKSGMTFHVEASLRTRASAFIYTVDEIIMVPSYRRTTFAVEGYTFVEMFFILEWTSITTTEQAWQFRKICFQLCVKINIAIFNYIHECIPWMKG